MDGCPYLCDLAGPVAVKKQHRFDILHLQARMGRVAGCLLALQRIRCRHLANMHEKLMQAHAGQGLTSLGSRFSSILLALLVRGLTFGASSSDFAMPQGIRKRCGQSP